LNQFLFFPEALNWNSGEETASDKTTWAKKGHGKIERKVTRLSTRKLKLISIFPALPRPLFFMPTSFVRLRPQRLSVQIHVV